MATRVSTNLLNPTIGNFSGVRTISTNSSLGIADIGKLIVITSSCTITLPLASSVLSGLCYSFICQASGITIIRSGSDVIQPNSSTITTVNATNGDTLIVSSNGSDRWFTTSGSASLRYSDLFSAALNSNGYQKLPGGLIIQWGQTSGITAGSHDTVLFPITFPTATLSVYCTQLQSVDTTTTSNLCPSSSGTTTSQMTVRNLSASGIAIGHWMALGI